MGLLTKPIKSLDDLFVHTLQDIYYAEQQITKALPKMISKVSNPELKQGLDRHLGQTRNHVKRLEQVFQLHGEAPKAVTCPAIDGILEEANEIMGDAKDPDVLDAAWPADKPAPITFVIVPEYVARHWWERLLYNQSVKRLRSALLGRPHTVVVNVPYRREDPEAFQRPDGESEAPRA